MAKFLDTSGVSHYLQQLINKANERLILISPYLKINDRIKQSLAYKNSFNIDIRVIYGKDELQIEESKWLKSMGRIRTTFCKNLHAKCYLNESEAIITSMNLYTFSQENNYEMGIYVKKAIDQDLYLNIYEEVEKIIRVSEEYVNPIEKPVEFNLKQAEKEIIKPKDKASSECGYCIRTGIEIAFNLEKPFCMDAYKTWNFFGDINFKENFCHFTGEPSMGETSYAKPILKKNWKAAQSRHNFNYNSM